ncbi:MAG TPA: OB-fold domain-containing protein, partial [Streptosporangiaceae bacterium]
DPTGVMVTMLDEAGYTGVVATNSDHVFHRYLRHGEQLSVTVSLIGLTGPKRTALGEGWFFTTRQTWYSGDELVATMDFRILKFRPGSGAAPQAASQPAAGQSAAGGFVMRPVVSPDTAFFWEGTRQGELRIQQCADCGALRHPPGPMCPQCGSPNPKYLVASGAGTVFSYVVHHHPPVPGKQLPLVIALVELEEGVRVLAEMPGVRADQVSVGMSVEVGFLRIDDDLVLPAWRPAEPPPRPGELPAVLPEMAVDVSATFVVASALATRDFTPVHHDRDLAVANGSKDIFVNILTDNGLVQRFLSQWAGPQSLLRQTKVRLGVPCYAGDTLTFTGRVTDRTEQPDADRYEVQVTGTCSLGDHVIATAGVDGPRSQS